MSLTLTGFQSNAVMAFKLKSSRNNLVAKTTANSKLVEFSVVRKSKMVTNISVCGSSLYVHAMFQNTRLK